MIKLRIKTRIRKQITIHPDTENDVESINKKGEELMNALYKEFADDPYVEVLRLKACRSEQEAEPFSFIVLCEKEKEEAVDEAVERFASGLLLR